jgi:hypothetical protein
MKLNNSANNKSSKILTRVRVSLFYLKNVMNSWGFLTYSILLMSSDPRQLHGLKIFEHALVAVIVNIGARISFTPNYIYEQ